VFCSELAGPPVELLAGGRALFPELPAPVLSLVPSRRSPSRTAPGGPPRRPRRRARAAVERRPGAGDGRGVRRRHRATAPGFQRSVYFHPPTGTSIVVLTNLLLAPNTYFPEALPAERITQLVQQAVIEG
jgi:hypothetical protein